MRATIKQALQTMQNVFGEQVFTRPTKFKSGLADILPGAENELVRNLLNFSISEMNSYARLKSSPSTNEITLAIQNLASEMNRKNLTPENVSLVVIESFAELLGYETSGADFSLAQPRSADDEVANIEFAQDKPSKEELLSKARKGDLQSLLEIGNMHFNGENGFPKDVDKAHQIIESIAHKGHAEAQLRMAYFYTENADFEPIENDINKAISWFERSAENGNKQAMWELTNIHAHPNFGKMNFEKYCYWLEELSSVRHKDPLAMIMQGVILCGDTNSTFVIGFEQSEKLNTIKNPDKGFKLIEAGITLIDSDVEKAFVYEAIHSAYNYHYGFRNEYEKMGRGHKSLSERFSGVAKKAEYMGKAYKLAESELAAGEIERVYFEDIKRKAVAAKNEYEAMIREENIRNEIIEALASSSDQAISRELLNQFAIHLNTQLQLASNPYDTAARLHELMQEEKYRLDRGESAVQNNETDGFESEFCALMDKYSDEVLIQLASMSKEYGVKAIAVQEYAIKMNEVLIFCADFLNERNKVKVARAIRNDANERLNALTKTSSPTYDTNKNFESESSIGVYVDKPIHNKSSSLLGVLVFLLGVLTLAALLFGYGIIGYNAGRDDSIVRFVQNVVGNILPSSDENGLYASFAPTFAVPTRPQNIDAIMTAMISTSGESSFAIRSDGILYAWGANHQGVLGDGTFNHRYRPARIIDEAVYVTSGAQGMSPVSNHAMVIRSDGSLWAWGFNGYGQLGDGANVGHLTPVEVMDGVLAVSAGYGYTMAIRSDNSLWAWGRNEGRLGDGSITNQYNPVWIMDDVTVVSAGFDHTLAIRNDGSLWGWGNNWDGQLGDGTTRVQYTTPIRIMDDVFAISTNREHTLAIRNDRSLWAWGNNRDGRLGNGSTVNQPTPVRIMDDVIAVSAGAVHAMAIRTDGSLWAWGNNSHGQLGDGTTDNRYSPIRIMEDVIAVSSGDFHTIAIRSDGSLWAWGRNSSGQLGDGTSTEHHNPVRIMGINALPEFSLDYWLDLNLGELFLMTSTQLVSRFGTPWWDDIDYYWLGGRRGMTYFYEGITFVIDFDDSVYRIELWDSSYAITINNIEWRDLASEINVNILSEGWHEQWSHGEYLGTHHELAIQYGNFKIIFFTPVENDVPHRASVYRLEPNM
ncbi:MAG: hypothetical protein FWF81_04170 [Defluviitaleaceae bacterium]|nr:hypothetical protein [Defluviitaleaceae bacterium]